MTNTYHIIVTRDGSQYVAQLQEHDIAAQGPTLAEATIRLGVAIEAEANEPGGIERLPPAPMPEDFARAYDEAYPDGVANYVRGKS